MMRPEVRDAREAFAAYRRARAVWAARVGWYGSKDYRVRVALARAIRARERWAILRRASAALPCDCNAPDCTDRAECPKAGEFMHSYCGRDVATGRPRHDVG